MAAVIIDDKNAIKKKQFFTFRKFVLLAIILGFLFRLYWLYPRVGWKVKEPGTTNLIQKTSAKQIQHVILISIDTCRADHLSCYGYSRRTSPNIDSIAREGILFNHAITPAPTTLPAHSSMLTGTTPLYHKVRDNNNYRLSSDNLTIAEILKSNGFVTGAAIGAFVLNSQFGLGQGFDVYDDEIQGSSGPS